MAIIRILLAYFIIKIIHLSITETNINPPVGNRNLTREFPYFYKKFSIVTFYTSRHTEPQQNSYGNHPIIEVPVADLENF